MKTFIAISLYRILAVLIISTPIFVNWLVQGQLLVSFVYLPIWLCLSALIFIYIDDKLLMLAHYCRQGRVSKPSNKKLYLQASKVGFNH
ncbi:MAG: hypothetical protein ACSHW0_12655 [Thalassotalea sp.]